MGRTMTIEYETITCPSAIVNPESSKFGSAAILRILKERSNGIPVVINTINAAHGINEELMVWVIAAAMDNDNCCTIIGKKEEYLRYKETYGVNLVSDISSIAFKNYLLVNFN